MSDIYIYDIIGYGDSSAEAVRAMIAKSDPSKPLNVHINSDGGKAFDGFSIFNALKAHIAGVNVFVDGLAASAASVIAMAGTTITMGPMSFVMIHEAWTGVGGNKRDFRKMADLLENIDTVSIEQYAKRTKKEPEQIREWLEAETWFNAKQAVEHGIADAIAGEQTAMAFVEVDQKNEAGNRWGYKNVPASLLVDSSIAMRRRVNAKATPRRDDAEKRSRVARA